MWLLNNSIFGQDVLHVLLSSHASQHGGHELLATFQWLGRLVWVLYHPTGEGSEGVGCLVGILRLFPASVVGLGEVVLVASRPYHLEIAVDVNVFLVVHVEELQPAAQRFSTRVSVEGSSLNTLRLQPVVSIGWHIADVLLEHSC